MKLGMTVASVVACSAFVVQVSQAATLYSNLASSNPSASLVTGASNLTPVTVASAGTLSSISFYTLASLGAGANSVAVVNIWTDVPTTGVDDVLAGATLLGSATASVGTTLGTTLTTVPLANIPVSGTVYIQLEYFTDSTKATFSSKVQSFFATDGTSSVGSNPGWEWNDGSGGGTLDGIYTAAEAEGTNPPPGGDNLDFPGVYSIPLTNQFTLSGTAVPEPASLGLLGVAGMGLLRRRRA